MKMRLSLAVVVVSLMTCGTAGAWGVPSIPGVALLGGGASAGDPDAFLLKARASELLVNKSAEQLFGLVASKEEQAKAEAQQQKIDATSDAKEKEALVEEKVTSELAAITNASANQKLAADAKKWDSNKKSLAAKALFNLALGGKMAADLVPQGQSLVSSLKSNPMMLAKLGSLYEAVKCLGGIGTGTVKIMKVIPPVFSAANIEVKLPTSSADTPQVAEL